MENSFVKIGTNLEYNEQVCHFVDQIPEISQQQYKEFVNSGFIKCKKLVSDPIKKNNFVTPAKSEIKSNSKNSVSLKESDNKLRTAVSFLQSKFAELFTKEFTGFPECSTKNQEMYHGSKSALLEVYDSSPSCIPKIKPNAIVIDFSTIINSQACITRAIFLKISRTKSLTVFKKYLWDVHA